MSAAKSNTTPAPCWRARIGQPTTLGEFRRMTELFSDDAPLAVRNGPLPTLYYLGVDGRGHIEIEIPDIHANATVSGAAEPRTLDGHVGDINRDYCLICRREIMTESGQVCSSCAN